jgi:hypothetical protein
MPSSGRNPVKLGRVIPEKAARKRLGRDFAVLCRIRDDGIAIESGGGLW